MSLQQKIKKGTIYLYFYLIIGLGKRGDKTENLSRHFELLSKG